MAAAARRPAPMARITVAPPVTMSPPANTPGHAGGLGDRVGGHVAPLVELEPGRVAGDDGVGPWCRGRRSRCRTRSPYARRVGTGRRRPRSSGSPSSMRSSRAPVRRPPVVDRSASRRLCSHRNSMPSSSAWRSSSARARCLGAGCDGRRSAPGRPRRRATRRQSMAVLPAPTTTTTVPMPTGVSMSGKRSPPMRFTRVSSSLALYTCPASSPGMPRNDGAPAPTPRNTASKPVLAEQLVDGEGAADDLVGLDLALRAGRRPSTSRSMMSRGRRNDGMP